MVIGYIESSIMYKQIKSIDELRALATDDTLHCFISFGGYGGTNRSIWFNTKTEIYKIFNEDNSTCDEMTEGQLLKHSRVGNALKGGLLFIKD